MTRENFIKAPKCYSIVRIPAKRNIQQRKGHPVRDRLLALAALALIIGGDILTSIIC